MPANESSSAEKWEHFIVLLDAVVAEHKDYFEQTGQLLWLPKYSPEALIPQLNAYGSEGWELVSIQPVIEGRNGDGDIAIGSVGLRTHTYLCTFKRRI